MQTPSTAPYFVRGAKVTVGANNLLLCWQPNKKLRDRQLGHFTIEERIGKHNQKLKLPTTLRLHPVFHVNNLRPCSTTFLRQHVSVTVPKEDDHEFDVSRIFVVCIKSLHG
jgi:hypothetical protein